MLHCSFCQFAKLQVALLATKEGLTSTFGKQRSAIGSQIIAWLLTDSCYVVDNLLFGC